VWVCDRGREGEANPGVVAPILTRRGQALQWIVRSLRLRARAAMCGEVVGDKSDVRGPQSVTRGNVARSSGGASMRAPRSSERGTAQWTRGCGRPSGPARQCPRQIQAVSG
jgi:nitrous oxidase accessory protein NosD